MSQHKKPIYERSDPGFLISTTLLIPSSPSGTNDVIFPAVGQYFRCKESTAALLMSFNNQQFFNIEVGIGFDAGEQGFDSLIFRNTSASDITITFYAGNVNVVDARLNTLISRQISTYQKNYSTFPRAGNGSNTISVTAGTPVQITESVGLRKQLIVTNLDLSSDVDVTDTGNNKCGTVMPRSAWTVESGGTFKLSVAAGTVSIRILEIYYNT